MSKKKVILLCICLIVVIALVVKVNGEKDEYRNVMKEAAYIDNTEVIDGSLTGQYVILSGVPVMSQGAYDQDLDIHFDYPVVYRSSYSLYNNGAGGQIEMKWKEFDRTDDNAFGTADFCGEAKIGTYTISGDVLKYVFESSTDAIVNEALAGEAGWHYYRHYNYAGDWMFSAQLTDQNNWENIADNGIIRVTYNAKSTEGKECTVFGYLDENGRIVSTDEYDVKYELGLLNKDEFIEKY